MKTDPKIESLADDLWFRLHHGDPVKEQDKSTAAYAAIVWALEEAMKHGIGEAKSVCKSQTYNGDYYSESTDAHDGGVRCCVSAIEDLTKRFSPPVLSSTQK